MVFIYEDIPEMQSFISLKMINFDLIWWNKCEDEFLQRVSIFNNRFIQKSIFTWLPMSIFFSYRSSLDLLLSRWSKRAVCCFSCNSPIRIENVVHTQKNKNT